MPPETSDKSVTILEKGTVKSLSTHNLVAGEFEKASCMGYQVLNYKQFAKYCGVTCHKIEKQAVGDYMCGEMYGN